MNLTQRSITNLEGVHPDLKRVVYRAATLMPADGSLGFVVTEGLRTKARQAALVKAGASQTMNSRHLTGHAVDLAATIHGEVRWDWPLYLKLNDAMKEAARVENVSIEWGGAWLKFKDGPHFQLPVKAYS